MTAIHPWSIASPPLRASKRRTSIKAVLTSRYSDTDSANQGGTYRSEDVAFRPKTDIGGRFNAGWIESGDWLEYTINVPAAGTYQFRTNSVSPPPARLLEAALCECSWTVWTSPAM